MASQRKTAEAYRTPALDMATAKGLSKEELLAALEDMAAQELIDTSGANAILRERTAIKQQALTAATPDSSETKKELSPEDIKAYLEGLKPRFDALKRLHPGLTLEEVKKALRANPEAIKKLLKLDKAGFEMNVFRSSTPNEIVFRTAQLDVTKIDPKYRTIMADKQSQLEYPEYKVNGNAEEISGNLGVELADGELYEQQRVQNGWVWLKTDAATRKSGDAFFGDYRGVYGDSAYLRDDVGSFCAALRVKKV